MMILVNEWVDHLAQAGKMIRNLGFLNTGVVEISRRARSVAKVAS